MVCNSAGTMGGRVMLVVLGVLTAPLFAEEPTTSAPENGAIDGKELFLREWLPNDPRSHGGDGLGPVFNDTSCIACHNQGGVGGAGPAGKNVDVITAFANRQNHQGSASLFVLVIDIFGGGQSRSKAKPEVDKRATEEAIQKQRARLTKIHPGFRTARSVVLHRFGTSPGYAAFRGKLDGLGQFSGMMGGFGMPGLSGAASMDEAELAVSQEIGRLNSETQFGGNNIFSGPANVSGFAFVRSQRNAIALFGSGQIDLIPSEVLVAAAESKYADFPEVTGRAAKQKDGQIGRFGWKGQMASLNDFVLTACGIELGLHVPGQPQSGDPEKADYAAPGFDLNDAECNALVSFVAKLPTPVSRQPANAVEENAIATGNRLFGTVGCASCHTPNLGEVAGVFTDLLLHDMGPGLADTGNYGSFVPNSTEDQELNELLPPLDFTETKPKKMTKEQAAKLIGALRHEWRTPPLWGVRDSAPYLHDGRAATLEQAIALHGGEAEKITRNYFSLSGEERLYVRTFLKSLVAPE